MIRYAYWLYRADRRQDADDLSAAALERIECELEAGNNVALVLMQNYALYLSHVSRFDEAVAFGERVYEMQKYLSDAQHPRTVESRAYLEDLRRARDEAASSTR